ncbi:hypothetical protein ANN_05153 [Periplaneta americana]|uniref:Uncharacterized protein n=1 Tax=Periplaneta americana TaxID=6978 RepID=A0ABQ8TBL5_PERAM|nr:hypothetical protein ANN_05153 [Periplaneta americana]
MTPGSSTESYPAFAQNWVEGKPQKKPQPGNLPRPGFEAGPSGFAASRANRYSTVILPVVLFGCETWTLTLREEQRLRVFENKVLRKICEAKRDEVTGEWRKLHNAELHALYSSPDIIRNVKSRRLRWAGRVARMGESKNEYRVLVGRPEGKRPLGRPRRRWEDNIKMDLREMGYDDRDWINLAQDRDRWRAYVRAAMNLRGALSEKLDLLEVFDFAAFGSPGIIVAVEYGTIWRFVVFKSDIGKPVKTVFCYVHYLASEWDEGDNAGEMSPGSNTESYPAFTHIGLRENPGKNLNQVACPNREFNPGHLVSRPDALTVTPQVWNV